MKCWKCGEENVLGSNTCVFCGASQKDRSTAVTEVGKAMRMLYDQYGAQTTLTNSAYLVNGLGDLTQDSKKLRNQMKMALDAGLGRLYLEQIPSGAPDGSFDARVKRLLTEDAGLNEKAAAEISGYFDEMIGWRQITCSKSVGDALFWNATNSVTPLREVDRSEWSRFPEQENQAMQNEPAVHGFTGKKKWLFLLPLAATIVLFITAPAIAADEFNSDDYQMMQYICWGLIAILAADVALGRWKTARVVLAVLFAIIYSYLMAMVLNFSIFNVGSSNSIGGIIISFVLGILVGVFLSICLIKSAKAIWNK